MAVTSYDFATEQKQSRPSVLRRLFDALVEARTQEAQRYVNAYLRSLDDDTLASLGHKREDLMKDQTSAYRF